MSDEAGRDLDARVAVEVMGWTLADRRAMGWGDGPPVWITGESSDDPNSSPTWQDFRPSTDIAAAWEVVENLADAGWLVEVSGKACHPGQWCAHVISVDGEHLHDAVADTAPLAICLASLSALARTPDSAAPHASTEDVS